MTGIYFINKSSCKRFESVLNKNLGVERVDKHPKVKGKVREKVKARQKGKVR